jgi:hypothetical protein
MRGYGDMTKSLLDVGLNLILGEVSQKTVEFEAFHLGDYLEDATVMGEYINALTTEEHATIIIEELNLYGKGIKDRVIKHLYMAEQRGNHAARTCF